VVHRCRSLGADTKTRARSAGRIRASTTCRGTTALRSRVPSRRAIQSHFRHDQPLVTSRSLKKNSGAGSTPRRHPRNPRRKRRGGATCCRGWLADGGTTVHALPLRRREHVESPRPSASTRRSTGRSHGQPLPQRMRELARPDRSGQQHVTSPNRTKTPTSTPGSRSQAVPPCPVIGWGVECIDVGSTRP
jgi:hypothetical protein